VASKVSLTVNDNIIMLDSFCTGYLDHVTGGIVASLKGTGEIDHLELEIDDDGIVTLSLNGDDVPLNFFATEIVRNTIFGMVKPLKGVGGEIESLEMKINR
jgi:hypothetical protein